LDAVTALLRQGITPEKVALAVALAAVLAVFPVLGSTTLLCAAAAALLGLNLPLMQLVNLLMYPVQLLLLIPLMNLGTRLFGFPLVPPLAQLFHQVSADPWGVIRNFWPTALAAIAAWVVLSPVVAGVIYAVLILPLRRFAPTREGAAG